MTLIYAHRGLHVADRENTLEAFRAALELGVDGVELDVRRTLDGELVVHHDPAIGRAAIARASRADLPAYVATLHEALDACGGLKVNVELKNSRRPANAIYDESSQLARHVVEVVRNANCIDSVLFSCFDFDTCVQLRSLDDALQVGWLWNVVRNPTRALRQAHEAGLNAVHPNYRRVDATLLEQARDVGLALNVWTVNAPADIEVVAALGVDAIITDDPATALVLVR